MLRGWASWLWGLGAVNGEGERRRMKEEREVWRTSRKVCEFNFALLRGEHAHRMWRHAGPHAEKVERAPQ
jgi:hypothetical protein